MEGKSEEDQNDLQNQLSKASDRHHPLRMIKVDDTWRRKFIPGPPRRLPVKGMPNVKGVPTESEKPDAGNGFGRKTDYVPSWWLGEDRAYHKAKTAMTGINSLPKMKK